MDAHYEALMVKVTDETASPAEREELMSWLLDKPELRQELEQHQALKAVTDGWVARLETDLLADRRAAAPSTQWVQRIGIGLLLVGLAVMYGHVFTEALVSSEAPLLIRLGLSGTLLGIVVLLGSVIRGRLQDRKTDRYKEVIR